MRKRFSKLIALILPLVLVFAAVTVSAAVNRITLNAGESVVEQGDKIVVSVTMNEAITLEDSTVVLQLELNYDDENVTYVSHELSSAYKFMDVVVSENAPVIKAYWIYMMDLGINFDAEMDEEALTEMLANVDDEIKNPSAHTRELPAGTVLTVTFTVNEGTDVEEVVSSLSNSFTLSTDGNVTNAFDGSVTVKVCAGHEDANDDGICDHCGTEFAKYTPGDVNNDGDINNIDAMLVLQYTVGIIGETELCVEAADVNGDGEHNNIDAMLILQYTVGIILEFPQN